MKRTLTLHLPILSAKSWQEYLDANDGDADRAGRAARGDVADRERQNSAARRFVDAYKPLIQHLKLSESPDDAESAGAQAVNTVKQLQTAAGSSGDATKQLEAAHNALKELGIDPAKLKEGVEGAKAKFAEAGEAGKLRRTAEFGKAAKALGFDEAKLAHQLRDETALPEQRKVKVKVRDAQGVETEQEQDVWGLPTLQDGKETAFTPIADHAGVKGFEASLKAAATTPASGITPPAVPATATFTLPTQPAAPAPAPGGAKLDLGGLSTGNAV